MRTMAEGFDKTTAVDASSGKRRLQSHLMLRMLSIDREIATAVIGMWTDFLTNNANRGETWFQTLGDYLAFRIEEVGSDLEIGLIMFGCRIPLTDAERKTCFELAQPAWTALALTNDLFSWDKEQRSAAASNKESYISNALFVIMKEHDMSLDEAKQMARRLIRENNAKYMQVVRRTKQNPDRYSQNVIRLLDNLVYVVSGNLVWSASCPRYHPDVSYSEKQIEWMTNGLPEHLLKEKKILPGKRPMGDANGAHVGNSNGTTNGVKNGANGIAKSNGTNGVSKTNGVNGTSHTNGVNGTRGAKRAKHTHANTPDLNGISNGISHQDLSPSRPLRDILRDHHLTPLSSDVCLSSHCYGLLPLLPICC